MTGDPSSTQPKALGLEWDSRLDLIAPAIKLAAYYKETKRGVVADVSRTFDILGWISPAVVLMKLLYQKLWQLKIGWDEPVPDDLIKLHSTWRKQLPVLCNKKIPRYYCRSHSSLISRELHGFADASAKAYGAVVYLRTTYHHHPPLLSLVVSKTRVAKLTPSTIPRQELCAAVLLTELLSEVKTILNIPDEMVYAWSDSSIVLSWLDGHPRDYKVFVTNRVSSILQVTTPSTWRHVPTTDNPADCASRGVMPEELLNHTLWWEGPEWLLHQSITIPHQPPRKPLLAPEQRPHRVNVVHFTPPPMMETRFSNYHKMIKVTAWCWRFCQKVRKKSSHSGRLLASQELTTAEHLLARLAQSRSFPKERDALLHNRPIPSTSRILSLTPYLDENQLLRVGGRLSNNSSLTPSQVHPIIQDSRDPFMSLLFTYMHGCLGHCGPSLLLCAVGWRYHVVSARRLTRSVCSQCKICRRAAPKPQPPLMGQLPEARTTTTPAFQSTGLDFAGPFTIKKGHTRKPVHLKAYICIFVCLSTKAIHMEVISGISTAAFLGGLRRFVARRGCPKVINSDNGSNFVGAKNQLSSLYKFLQSEDTNSVIHQHLLKTRTTWKNIPERAPHFGGLRESAVRSMKHHLKRVVGAQILTYEELETVVCQIEACLNSQPILTRTSHDSDGIFTLTAGHFLLLKPPTAYPEDPRLPEEPHLLRKWNMCQAMVQHFWDRWSREYLQTLQSRSKWRTNPPSLQVGDIVILKEDKTFSCHWPLAKILHTYPGKDGVVRVAQIQAGDSIFKRPVTKLALLHREKDQVQPPAGLPPAVCLGKEPDNQAEDSTASIGGMPDALTSD